MFKLLSAALIFVYMGISANAQSLTVYKCEFEDLQFYITIAGDNSTARVGTGINIGSISTAYFDRMTGVWIILEYIANGSLPSTMTSVSPNGRAVHSRHTVWLDGTIQPSQRLGWCAQL